MLQLRFFLVAQEIATDILLPTIWFESEKNN
jgi:hypothetical protein